MGSYGGSSMAFIIRTRAFLFAICFLVFVLGEKGGIQAAELTTTTTLTLSGSKHESDIARDSRRVHRNLDPIYVSKRSVPNGADPIHNRRAGKSIGPTGRA